MKHPSNNTMSKQSINALLHAAGAASAKCELSDLVKYTTALADALGVSRQAVHTWQRRPDSPRRIGGYWSVRAWQDYMKAHNLAVAQKVDRATAVTELCTVVMNNLPPRLPRRRLLRLLERIETALHVTFAGTRFRSATCIHALSQNDV